MWPAATRKFSGKPYKRQTFHSNKADADKQVMSWRRHGHAARVATVAPFQFTEAGNRTPTTMKYIVYVRFPAGG